MLQIVIFVKEVAVIFMDLIKDAFIKALKFAKKNRILVRFTAFALVAMAALVISIISCGIKVGYNVNYGGKNIAVIDNAEVFKSAKEKITTSLANKKDAKKITTPKFLPVVTIEGNLSNKDELADAIVESTDALDFSSALTVNGEVLVYANRSELEKLVNAALCKYYVKGADNTSAFLDDVSIVDTYCLKENIKSEAKVKKIVNGLKVKTISTVTSESSVKYSTKTIYTSTKVRGYEKVKTKGVKGLKTETAVIETLNGKETAKTVIARKLIKEPVEKVVVKGTAVSTTTATARAEAKSAGFICPMNKGSIKQVSAYWGDGRNHQAMDFSGNVGTPIFAAKAGTVVEAGWDGNYGYAVVIDHGNGYKTRYAHANALCVKKGATVKQGQQVATLGNTGRSTGPHLHFEVIKNGTRVNPAPYIGY